MNTAIPTRETDITREKIVERARDMIPVLRELAGETERRRTLATETVEDFRRAGFYRILQPRRFGGYQLGLRTFCDVMINISRGCASSGWVLCLTSAHTFHMAAFPEAGQVEMYGDDGEFRAPLIFAPQGTAVPVDGGYRITGRWNYNSGGEHANWLIMAAALPGDGARAPTKDLLMVIIRREDYEIFDNWHVMGMRGPGSKQAVVKDVFVPSQRAISQTAWLLGDAPGYGVHDDPFYSTPPMEVFCTELSSICVGVGEAAIDAYHERVMTKKNAYPPFELLRTERSAQRRLGHARARVDAAAAVVDRMIGQQAEYAERAAAGRFEFPSDTRRRVFMLAQQVVRNVTEAVDPLFETSGTSATQSGQQMERIYRDLATIRTHFILDADRSAENWGATFLGLDAYSPY